MKAAAPDTLDMLLRVSSDSPDQLEDAIAAAGDQVTPELAEGAFRTGQAAANADDFVRAESAYALASLAYNRVGDLPLVVVAATAHAEVMKVRGETVDAYESARHYACGLAGTARELHRPQLAFSALTVAADCAYFAAR